jgi:uncharacterized membrane protein
MDINNAPVTQSPRELDSLNARSLLLPWALGVTALCLTTQLVIAARGSEVDAVAWLLTVLVAFFYAGFLILRRDQLRRVRFASLVAHAVTYVVVIGSFQLHAALLAFSNSDGLRGDDHLPLEGGWFGVTFAMAGFWAVGFTVHAIASIAQRGFED